MDTSETKWFALSRGELRVLLVACALVLASLGAVSLIRKAFWTERVEVEGARETLSIPPRLDANSSPGYELQLLPGIGEATARAIVEERRENGYFQNLDDLTRVDGIGEKTVENLRPHLMCRPPDRARNSRGTKGP